ncbi:hypothetical protein GGF37_006203, partial [Kickxella alabastrina]
VRRQAQGATAAQVPTTAERGSAPGPNPTSGAATVHTVRCPVACLRILLLLTALRYGSSLSDTPIHIWLTDCLDYAPVPLLQQYFTALLGSHAPKFSPDLPVEADWSKKAMAFVKLWAADHRIRARRMVLAASAAIICYALQDAGAHWAERWAEWAPTIAPVVAELFSKPAATALHEACVHAMLAMPLPPPAASAATADAHPLYMLARLMNPEDERGRPFFASSRDWFFTQAMPVVLAGLAAAGSNTPREFLARLLSSVETMYAVVPWLDVATSLVQNVSLSRGFPVAMMPEVARANFVSFLSPLARVLLAISDHVEGRASSDSGAAAEDDSASVPDTAATADSTADDPMSPGHSSDSGGHDAAAAAGSDADADADADAETGSGEGDFNWPWLEENLVVYVVSSLHKNALNDTIDALLDVYTHSSVRSLRRSIENVAVASSLHTPQIARIIVDRLMAKRPLDIFSLHSLRPRTLSEMATQALPPVAGVGILGVDPAGTFRPGAEIFPLACRILDLALGATTAAGAGAAGAEEGSSVAAVARLIEDQLWA